MLDVKRRLCASADSLTDHGSQLEALPAKFLSMAMDASSSKTEVLGIIYQVESAANLVRELEGKVLISEGKGRKEKSS